MKSTAEHADVCYRPMARQGGAALIVLMVVFILGSAYFLLNRLNLMTDAIQQTKLTTQRLNQVREALLGYAVMHGRLPCPDTDTTPDGTQNGPACTGQEGVIPWVDLGIAYQDGWGRYIRYRADDNFSVAVPPDPNTDNAMTVKNLTGTSITTEEVTAVIFSCGVDGIPNNANDKNGVDNTSATCIDTGAGDTTSYIQDVSQTGFDDVLIFIPKSQLQARMSAIGNWP